MTESAGNSGYVDFNERDLEIIQKILGNYIKEIGPSDYPGYKIARFQGAPDSVIDELVSFWGQFEWLLDEHNV